MRVPFDSLRRCGRPESILKPLTAIGCSQFDLSTIGGANRIATQRGAFILAVIDTVFKSRKKIKVGECFYSSDGERVKM